jgi:hypothetical protein
MGTGSVAATSASSGTRSVSPAPGRLRQQNRARERVAQQPEHPAPLLRLQAVDGQHHPLLTSPVLQVRLLLLIASLLATGAGESSILRADFARPGSQISPKGGLGQLRLDARAEAARRLAPLKAVVRLRQLRFHNPRPLLELLACFAQALAALLEFVDLQRTSLKGVDWALYLACQHRRATARGAERWRPPDPPGAGSAGAGGPRPGRHAGRALRPR